MFKSIVLLFLKIAFADITNIYISKNNLLYILKMIIII